MQTKKSRARFEGNGHAESGGDAPREIIYQRAHKPHGCRQDEAQDYYRNILGDFRVGKA